MWYVPDGKGGFRKAGLFECAAAQERSLEPWPHGGCIQKTDIGNVHVSTMFLYCAFGDEPQLFETLVQGGPRNGHIQRYSTASEAVQGHTQIVAEVSRG